MQQYVKFILVQTVIIFLGIIVTAIINGSTSFLTSGTIIKKLGGITEEDLKDLRSYSNNIIATSVPQDTVLALDADKCPSGWESFSAAGGRFIVGAGYNQNGLKTYRRGETGGLERVALTVREIPSHTHDYNYVQFDNSSSNFDIAIKLLGHSDKLTKTSATGGGEAHENRPPYIALTLCKKLR